MLCEDTTLVPSPACSSQLFPYSSIIRSRVICRLPPWVLYNSLLLSPLIRQIRINDWSTQWAARDLLYNMEALEFERYSFLQKTITCTGITHHSYMSFPYFVNYDTRNEISLLFSGLPLMKTDRSPHQTVNFTGYFA